MKSRTSYDEQESILNIHLQYLTHGLKEFELSVYYSALKPYYKLPLNFIQKYLFIPILL